MPVISAERFDQRLKALMRGGVGPGLPRREEDRHIMLKAVVLALHRNSPYSEAELGKALAEWLATAGPGVELDPVTLRRALVDFGYLRRDPAGRRYELRSPSPARFAPEVEQLVPLQLMLAARERARQKAPRGKVRPRATRRTPD